MSSSRAIILRSMYVRFLDSSAVTASCPPRRRLRACPANAPTWDVFCICKPPATEYGFTLAKSVWCRTKQIKHVTWFSRVNFGAKLQRALQHNQHISLLQPQWREQSIFSACAPAEMLDNQLPLLGVIICCTSVEPERRVSQCPRERVAPYFADYFTLN